MQPVDDSIPTRATLLHRLKDWQDQRSWQDFFDTYWKLIYSVAIKGGLTKSEAQDVVQETMMAVAKHMPSFQYDPSLGRFKAWLLNLTRWRIIDQYRKRSPNPPEDTATGTKVTDKLIDPASDDLKILWDTEWKKTMLEAALVKVRRRVDPQKFQIFDLYVNKEWPPERVAKAFGITVNQVYLAKHRVADEIKSELSRLEEKGT